MHKDLKGDASIKIANNWQLQEKNCEIVTITYTHFVPRQN